MVATPAIRNLIREEKSHQIDSVIASSRAEGMVTMDQSLFALAADGTISKKTALAHAIHQEALANRFAAGGLVGPFPGLVADGCLRRYNALITVCLTGGGCPGSAQRGA